MLNVLEEIQTALTEQYGIAREIITPEATFETIGIDSLALIELMFGLEDKFQIQVPQEQGAELKTIGDVVALIESLIARKTETAGA